MKKLFYHVRVPFVALAHDIVMIFVAWVLAYFLRFNLGMIPQIYLLEALQVLPILIVVQVSFYYIFSLYRGVWRYASIPDLMQILKAVVSGCVVTVLILFLFSRIQYVPRSIFPLYGILLMALLGGSRLFYRYVKDHGHLTLVGKRVLIIGAGQAGEGVVRDLLRNRKHYYPVAFVDDAPYRLRKKIHGIAVVGKCEDIGNVVKKYSIDMIVIAIPSAKAEDMRRIVQYCQDSDVPFQTLPGLADLTDGRVTVQSLREVALEDLLGREQVQLDWKGIKEDIVNKSILVTGGGGSIGSELCRQIANLDPLKLVIIDNSEFNLYSVELELRESFPDLKLEVYLVDVTDKRMVARVFDSCKPEIVFHAAAYKHVPLLEKQVDVAVKNNVLGTNIMAQTAIKNGTEKFILISSDKAVNPTNVMGATKRAAEIVCQNLSNQAQTKFITVRFGNVLGSVGSVVPLFKKQLEKGGPITVTHPNITRYFMTIPEAVSLILQAHSLGEGGELFVLDMGKQIKVQELAEQMIRLAGKEPGVDINIEHVGLRPGEKLYEELFYEHEKQQATAHKKIFRAMFNLEEVKELEAGKKFDFIIQQYEKTT
jgi:FlaA1/EpsC-like NDP-sugar epimerase